MQPVRVGVVGFGEVQRFFPAAFRARGLAVDVREIAGSSGVGVATLYRHFPTKNDLVTAVLTDDIAQWKAITAEAAADDDAWAGLTAFVDHTLQAVARHRAILDCLTEGGAPAG
ncbi:helix-turn-helix domain-containing protein [Saccharomonospora sp. NPDC006951]